MELVRPLDIQTLQSRGWDITSTHVQSEPIKISFAKYRDENTTFPRLQIQGARGTIDGARLFLVRRIKQRAGIRETTGRFMFANYGWRHARDGQIVVKNNYDGAVNFYTSDSRTELLDAPIWSEFGLEVDPAGRNYILTRTVNNVKVQVSFSDIAAPFITNTAADKNGDIIIRSGATFSTLLNIKESGRRFLARLKNFGFVMVDRDGNFISNILEFSIDSFVIEGSNNLSSYLKY